MTRLMGIMNLTPDSFSGDGWAGNAPEGIRARIDAMIEAGSDIIDVGAESTRPAAVPLSSEEEWQRIAPFMPFLQPYAGQVTLSIDTYHPETAKRALDHGFSWVNDVSGGDVAMFEAMRGYDATLVLMHSLCVPADAAQVLAEQADPVQEVLQWGRSRLALLEAHGVERRCVVLDPGIGFGKTAAQSWSLVHQAHRFREWGVRVLVGHSRKSFLGESLLTDRDAATLAVSLYLARQDVDLLRVHDVRAHRVALRAQQRLV